MNKTAITIGASVVGAAISFYGGYLFAESKLNRDYNEQMEAEIARVKEHYRRTTKQDIFSTPAGAAEAFGVDVAEAADAVRKHEPIDYTKFANKVTVTDVHEISINAEQNPFTVAAGMTAEEAFKVGEVEEHNVFEQTEEAEDIGFSVRDPERPYKITMIEFAANDDEYEQLSATYYAGDGILADDQDREVPNVDAVIGKHNLELFGDKNVIYVRNERLRSDYEVNKSERSFAHEVAGFAHSDEIYERTPKRRRGADE